MNITNIFTSRMVIIMDLTRKLQINSHTYNEKGNPFKKLQDHIKRFPIMVILSQIQYNFQYSLHINFKKSLEIVSK
jgi:hypothetical protein